MAMTKAWIPAPIGFGGAGLTKQDVAAFVADIQVSCLEPWQRSRFQEALSEIVRCEKACVPSGGRSLE
jgi:hypothetical protein